MHAERLDVRLMKSTIKRSFGSHNVDLRPGGLLFGVLFLGLGCMGAQKAKSLSMRRTQTACITMSQSTGFVNAQP